MIMLQLLFDPFTMVARSHARYMSILLSIAGMWRSYVYTEVVFSYIKYITMVIIAYTSSNGSGENARPHIRTLLTDP